jgi:integrase
MTERYDDKKVFCRFVPALCHFVAFMLGERAGKSQVETRMKQKKSTWDFPRLRGTVMNLKEIAYSHYLPAKRKRRHTWATIAVEAGAGIEAVAMVLGHGSINTTQQYYLQPTRKICAGVQALVSERIVGALFRIPRYGMGHRCKR